MNEESPERVLAEVRAACEAFGAAREGTHLAAYAQGRVIRNVTWLLAEGRWALAGLSDAGALVDAIRAGKLPAVDGRARGHRAGGEGRRRLGQQPAHRPDAWGASLYRR